MSWRAARSLLTLRSEVDARWPRRSKASDGMLGDSQHASRPSDHNPNSAGVVRAIDITAAGIDAAWYAEHLRALGASGHPALRNGGVVIYNRRIASSTRGWAWRPYTGANPHTSHIHTSVSRDATGYDSTAPWGITDNDKDDFMSELTAKEQREILNAVRTAAEKATNASLLAASVDQRCERLERSIHGVDQTTKAESVWVRVKYLAAELVDEPKGPMLDRVLRKHGAG